MDKHADTSPEARGARFVLAIERYSGMKGAELARRLGIENEQNITNWKRRGVPSSMVSKVAKELNISRDWLETGLGEACPDSQKSPRLDNPDTDSFATEELGTVYGPRLAVRKGRKVPVLGKAQLGTDGFFEVMDYPLGQGDGFLDIYSPDPGAYALKVIGHSMRPRIKDGEFVLIEPSKFPVSGDEVLVRTTGGRAMIKELMYLRDGVYRFDSVNENVSPIFIPEEEVLMIHFVAGQYKSHLYHPD